MSAAPAQTTRKIPATIVTGFLGAGKTSLIRHVIESSGGRRIALIVNEFGDVGVDGEMLRACGFVGCGDDDIVELANGCICCTVADDFLPVMERLLARPRPPEHILIETSGLALPKPLVRAFGWPSIRGAVTVDGVIAVVDAAATAAGLFAPDPAGVAAARADDPSLDHESPLEELFEEQLACADMVVLNKLDLVSTVERAVAREAVRCGLRSGIDIVEAHHGRIAADLLLGLSAAAEDDLASRPSHHEGADDHDHDDFATIVLPLSQARAAATVEAIARELLRLEGVLRIKGFAAVEGKPMRLVVQGVGAQLACFFDRPWKPGEARRGMLVLIGLQGFPQERARQLASAFGHEPGTAPAA